MDQLDRSKATRPVNFDDFFHLLDKIYIFIEEPFEGQLF